MKKYFILYSFIFIILSACSPVTMVFTEPVPTQKVKTYQTFAFAEINKRPAVNRVNSESVKEFVEQAVTRELEQKGLKRVDENPDLLVDLYTSLRNFDREETSQTYYNRRGYFSYYRYGYYGTGRQSRLETEPNMSVVVNLTFGDADDKIKIGSGEIEANLTRNAEKSAQRLDQAVEKLVESLIKL